MMDVWLEKDRKSGLSFALLFFFCVGPELMIISFSDCHPSTFAWPPFRIVISLAPAFASVRKRIRKETKRRSIYDCLRV